MKRGMTIVVVDWCYQTTRHAQELCKLVLRVSKNSNKNMFFNFACITTMIMCSSFSYDNTYSLNGVIPNQSNQITLSARYGDLIHIPSKGVIVLRSLYHGFSYDQLYEIDDSKISFSEERFAITENGGLYFLYRDFLDEYRAPMAYPLKTLRIDQQSNGVRQFFSSGAYSGFVTSSDEITVIGVDASATFSRFDEETMTKSLEVWAFKINRQELMNAGLNNESFKVFAPSSGFNNFRVDGPYILYIATSNAIWRVLFNYFGVIKIEKAEDIAREFSRIGLNNFKSVMHFQIFSQNRRLKITQKEDKVMSFTLLCLSDNINAIYIQYPVLKNSKIRNKSIISSERFIEFPDECGNAGRFDRLTFFENDENMSISQINISFGWYIPLHSSQIINRTCLREPGERYMSVVDRLYDSQGEWITRPTGRMIVCVDQNKISLYDFHGDYLDFRIDNNKKETSIINAETLYFCRSGPDCLSEGKAKTIIHFLGSISLR
jgi:hypothetical protein